MFTSLPLIIDKGQGFRRNLDVSSSVRSFIEIIVSCPLGSFAADPDFGFVFKNFRFQNFNEDKGVLFSSEPEKESSEYYSYKIQGHGINFNTFAHELKVGIERFEPRLKQVKVRMEYSPLQRSIEIIVSGKTNDNLNDNFEHIIKMHVW